ncbi:MAG: GGDEF domain-containing protein [Usitatibacter sp.]
MMKPQDDALGPFALDLLNALEAHIAVLDAQGRIVAVNEAWRRFARDNGGGDGTSPVGMSYVSVCETAIRRGEKESAGAMLDGMRLLLRGERDSFSLEYPCHSPAEQRWFVAHVTRFFHEGAIYLVAVHEDITARKRVQQELLEANRAVDAVNRELQEVLAREQLMARTDDLTGLNNRRRFFELSGQLFAVAQRYHVPFCVVMLDIDHFKRINDMFGHQVGDTILQCVGRMALEQTRAADVLARYGGEEFIVALPNTTAHEGLAAAENIRRRIAACRGIAGTTEVEVTVSAGVAEMLPGDDSIDRVIRRADEALYEAKKAGRNRTRVMSPPP